jgi:hypothetical protein
MNMRGHDPERRSPTRHVGDAGFVRRVGDRRSATNAASRARLHITAFLVALVACWIPSSPAADALPVRRSIRDAVDLDVNEAQIFRLYGEGSVRLKLFWESWQRQRAPKIIAVARPHHFVYAGEKVVLDGSKSWSAAGRIRRYDWTFTDGSKSSGGTVERTYAQSGEYSEILKVTDTRGEVDYDFAIVLVIDKSAPDRLPPTIHPAFAPTMNLRPGDPVTFKVRSFRTTFGNETWDFGDGTEKESVKSDGNVVQHAPDGYAVTQHRFAKPGHYMVRVERTNEQGQRAIGHLHVEIGRTGNR